MTEVRHTGRPSGPGPFRWQICRLNKIDDIGQRLGPWESIRYVMDEWLTNVVRQAFKTRESWQRLNLQYGGKLTLSISYMVLLEQVDEPSSSITEVALQLAPIGDWPRIRFPYLVAEFGPDAVDNAQALSAESKTFLDIFTGTSVFFDPRWAVIKSGMKSYLYITLRLDPARTQKQVGIASLLPIPYATKTSWYCEFYSQHRTPQSAVLLPLLSRYDFRFQLESLPIKPLCEPPPPPCEHPFHLTTNLKPNTRVPDHRLIPYQFCVVPPIRL